MIDIRTKLTQDGRLEIPPEYWQALGWHIGDEQILRIAEDGEAHILTLQQAIKRAQEQMRRYIPRGRSLANELIAERRAEGQSCSAHPLTMVE
jgi:bifunctional DNA-binding transcriptional regulator/antitoxin component of YhaV-PrlF toxin-antitoxin module